MFLKHTTFNVFYLLILILNIYALASNNQLLRMIAMPLIGMSLMLYLLIKTKIEELFHKLIFIGLVLSLAGDIQLLFSTGGEFYFLTALIATLISYILYALAYFIDFKKDIKRDKRVGNMFLIVLLISNFNFYFIASRNLQGFNVFAVLYLLALSIMTVLSGYRHRRVNQSSFKLILTGSFAFVISDLSIGYYYFIEAESIMMISYLCTYLIAQYMVVMGTIARKPLRG